MRGEQIGCPGCGTGELKIGVALILPVEGPFNQCQRAMPLVQMAQGRLSAQLFDQAPATNAKHHFLLQAFFRVAGV